IVGRESCNTRRASIPTLRLAEGPDGVDEHGNVEHHKFGAKGEYAFKPKQHFELGEALGLMDFETASKLSGARFVVLTGGLARMERALGQFMLDVHTAEHGYTEVNPPLVVRDEVMYGTAQLPKFEADQFFVDRIKDSDVRDLAQLFFEEILEDDDRIKQAIGRPDIGRAFKRVAHARGQGEQEEIAELYMFDLARRVLSFEQGYPPRLGLIPTAEVSLTNLVR